MFSYARQLRLNLELQFLESLNRKLIQMLNDQENVDHENRIIPKTHGPYLETLSDAFFVLDHNLSFLFANRAYKTLIAAGGRKLRGKSFLDIHPGARHSPLARVFTTLKSETAKERIEDYNLELKRWFEYHISRHEQGYTVTIIDISEQKSSYLALQRREDQARYMFDQAPIGVGRVGLDGRWLSVNARCADIIGIPQYLVPGASYYDICLKEHVESEQLGFASLLKRHQSSLISERQIQRGDGSTSWVQLKISLISDAQLKPLYFLVILEDIAERKEVEESLQFALEAAQMGTWDFDAINNTTRRSPRFDEIYGYKNGLASWTYQDFLSHVYREDEALAEKAFREALLSGQNFSLECRILWPDRSIHWISLRGRVYLNHQGRAIQMAGTVMDITAQKDREEDLRNARQAAEDANREKSNFLANMSHEIRTPLGAILGFTDMLFDPNLKKEDSQEYLKIIARNGKSLAVLVDDILDLSKVEAGHLDVERIPVDVWELMENIGTLFRLKAESKGLKLNITAENEIPAGLKTDPARLRQILLNIVGNAIKFTSSGEVSVRLKLQKTSQDTFLIFTVEDTGPGISEEATQRLFQPFTQADSSTTRKFGGTGLGLALSRKLARALGGDVTLERSQVGEGSVFQISIGAEPVDLPKASTSQALPTVAVDAPKMAASIEATPPAATAPVAMSAKPPTAKPLTRALDGLQILVADDSPDNRLLISRILNKGGATIDLADDGNIAVEKARANSYDVVVMDMQMPNLDGYGATRQLRQEGFEGPIVALTANAMRNDRERCLEAGCSDYLPKPVDPVQLYRVLGNLTQCQTVRSPQ